MNVWQITNQLQTIIFFLMSSFRGLFFIINQPRVALPALVYPRLPLICPVGAFKGITIVFYRSQNIYYTNVRKIMFLYILVVSLHHLMYVKNSLFYRKK